MNLTKSHLDYLRDTAIHAGFQTASLAIEKIGWDERASRFVDIEGRPIGALFKLYPWEWMLQESFAPMLPRSHTQFIEPAWKMLLSNKQMLVVLWELFPEHPNLLPAHSTPESLGDRYARKPRLSREGANVQLRADKIVVETPGHYGAEGFIYQALSPLPSFDGRYAVVGTWIIGDTACGMGIREDASAVTQNMSTFVPHYFC